MKKTLLFSLFITPLTAFAHAGHSHFDPNTLIHYLGTPEHAIPFACLVLIAGLALGYRKKKAMS